MRAPLLLAMAGAAIAQTQSGANMFSIEKEIELGKRLAAQVQTRVQAQPDALLQAMGDRLTAKLGGPFQYHFYVYSQAIPQYEPIALPGGPVFVEQSMISSNADRTAAILSHAIAHISLRHYTREQTARELQTISSQAVGMPPANSLNSATRFKGSFELDADRLAIQLMKDAGYDPEALVEWLQALPVPRDQLAFGDRPVPSQRVVQAQQAVEAAK